jgi:hypothetical protein
MSAIWRGGREGFGRVPIRLRLTLAFAVTMAVVLAVTGAFVYVRFRSELDRTIDLNLGTQAAALAPSIAGSDAELASAVSTPLFRGHESFVPVLDQSGRVIDARSDSAARRRVTPADHAGHRELSRPCGADCGCDAR